MKDRIANGQFAPKPKRDTRFKKGDPRPPGAGRKPGQQNRLTRAVKEFLAELVDDPSVQEAVKERIRGGDAVAFFRALEHVIGRPKEKHDAQISGEIFFGWKK